MSFPPGNNGDPYRQGGIPGGYPVGYDASYSTQQIPQPQLQGQRYATAPSGYPQRGASVDVYGRMIPPPPPQMCPTSVPAGYSVYPRSAPIYAAPPPPPPPPGSTYYHQQQHIPYQGQMVSMPQNPYTGMPAYAHPQTAPLPPAAGGYSSNGNMNPYDPYGNSFNTAMARSYQEGFESRDRGRQRDDNDEDESASSDDAGSSTHRRRRRSRSHSHSRGHSRRGDRGRPSGKEKEKEKKWMNELVEAAIGLSTLLPPNVRASLSSSLQKKTGLKIPPSFSSATPGSETSRSHRHHSRHQRSRSRSSSRSSSGRKSKKTHDRTRLTDTLLGAGAGLLLEKGFERMNRHENDGNNNNKGQSSASHH